MAELHVPSTTHCTTYYQRSSNVHYPPPSTANTSNVQQPVYNLPTPTTDDLFPPTPASRQHDVAQTDSQFTAHDLADFPDTINDEDFLNAGALNDPDPRPAQFPWREDTHVPAPTVPQETTRGSTGGLARVDTATLMPDSATIQANSPNGRARSTTTPARQTVSQSGKVPEKQGQ